jgi:multiple antibiotic resistance protein
MEARSAESAPARGAPMVEPAQIFTFFFVTLGPLKAIGPFVARTRDVDPARTRQIALWAFGVATVSVVAGGLLGSKMLVTWRVSMPALQLSGGLVFFLVAMRQLLEQYEPPREAADPAPLPAAPLTAAARLVFPILLTPYGVAAAIALLASSPSTERTMTILILLVAVMMLNLLAMWFARQLLVGPVIVVLQVVGSVLAVMQVALSVQFILTGLRALGVLPAAGPTG